MNDNVIDFEQRRRERRRIAGTCSDLLNDRIGREVARQIGGEVFERLKREAKAGRLPA